ncbi:hypothetical protein ABH944_001809 [Caballeronia udeis]
MMVEIAGSSYAIGFATGMDCDPIEGGAPDEMNAGQMRTSGLGAGGCRCFVEGVRCHDTQHGLAERSDQVRAYAAARI